MVLCWKVKKQWDRMEEKLDAIISQLEEWQRLKSNLSHSVPSKCAAPAKRGLFGDTVGAGPRPACQDSHREVSA